MRNIKKSFPPGQRRARWLKHELNCHWNMSIECGGVKIKTDIDMRNLFYLSLGSTAKAQWTGKGRKVAFGFTWCSNFFCCVVFMLAGCLIEPCTVVSVVSFAVLRQPRVQVKILLHSPFHRRLQSEITVRQTRLRSRSQTLSLSLCVYDLWRIFFIVVRIFTDERTCFCLCCAALHVNLSRVWLSAPSRIARGIDL